MAKSIMQVRRECYLCRRLYNVVTVRGLEEHHVFQAPRRALSEQLGLKVWLCQRHHNVSGCYSVHHDQDAQDWLKAEAQAAYLRNGGELREWMRLMGKNYAREQ